MTFVSMDVRKQFPIFQQRPEYAYLDTAATAQVPEGVLAAMMAFETGYRANVHRGVYPDAEAATTVYEDVRGKVAAFTGAERSEVIFTAGATAGMNMVAQMLAERVHAGDEVLVSAMEHHSALLPWLTVAKTRGASVRTIPLVDDYRLAVPEMGMRTKVVVVTAASNVLGTVNPVAHIVAAAKKVGAYVVVDAAQYAPHLPIDFAAWGADAVVFSAHKMYGPMGVGVLLLRKALGEALAPAWLGGGMVKEVTAEGVALEVAPWVFEAGTPNVAGVIGLGAAIDFVRSMGWQEIADRELDLTRLLIVGLLSLDAVTVVGPMAMEDRIGVVSFSFPHLHPHDVASFAAEQGVALRAGHHCAMPLVQPIDARGLCRASIGAYTNEDDIARCIAALKYARRTLS